MKLYIDECQSNELVHRAIERGLEETTSVVYRGLSGIQDWNLIPVVVDGDYTLVTKNRSTFVGGRMNPARRGSTSMWNCIRD